MRFFLCLLTISWMACTSPVADQKPAGANMPPAEKEDTAFFPVSSYLEGQILDIKTQGINPLLFTPNEKGGMDSAWLAIEKLPQQLSPFFEQRIDSANRKDCYREKRFMDETIGYITLTYERKNNCTDSSDLKEWSVYIDPEYNTVKRVYLVRENEKIQRQLTWVAGRYARILTIEKEGSRILEDQTVRWHFEP